MFQLKRHCKSLEGELDGVKSEIVKIITEKDGFFKENGMLKDYKKAYEDIKSENLQLKKDIQKMIDDNKSFKSPNASQDNIVVELLDRSSPDGQEIGTDLQNASHLENWKSIISENGVKNENMKEDDKGMKIRWDQ